MWNLCFKVNKNVILLKHTRKVKVFDENPRIYYSIDVLMKRIKAHGQLFNSVNILHFSFQLISCSEFVRIAIIVYM